jgi:hypothetical protein
MSLRQRDTPDEQIKYLVSQAGGKEFVLEVAASWKVTFGFVNPSKSSDGYSRGDGHCLRVWEGEKLRAVFGNVTGFRDMSIPLARKVETQTGSAQWTMDSTGNFDRTEKVEVEQEFLPEGVAF